MRPGRLILAVFLAFQAIDGLFTYEATRVFGLAAEGNQLLATWMSVAGVGPALVAAKIMAGGCGVILYTCGANAALTGVTGLYLFGAVLPWFNLMSTLPHV